jgi:hypothetical protein
MFFVWLFYSPSIKIYLEGYHFESLEDIQSNVTTVLNGFFDKEFPGVTKAMECMYKVRI